MYKHMTVAYLRIAPAKNARTAALNPSGYVQSANLLVANLAAAQRLSPANKG